MTENLDLHDSTHEAADAEPKPRRARPLVIILSLIAVVALLGYVIAGIVPIAMHAGDSGESGGVAELRTGDLPEKPDGDRASFEAQEPSWRECENDMLCADVYAPLDWGSVDSGNLITLRLIKRPATGSDPIGTLFVNPGGPGASGAQYLAGSIDSVIPDAVQRDYDVVAWDPRGVGASSPVACLDHDRMDAFLFGDDELAEHDAGSAEWIDEARAEQRSFGAACAKNTGPLLGHVDTASTVEDLDMLRAIVGDDTLTYLGFSYGTYIGARYADAHPERAGRLVLDGAMDPAADLHEVVREQTRGFERSLREYAADCLERRDCPLVPARGGTVDEAMERIGALLEQVDADPLRGSDGRMLSSSTLLTAIITPLYSQSNWSYLDQLFESVGNGSADVGLALADVYYDRQDGRYTSNSTEAFSAINCLDYPRPAVDADAMRAEADALAEIAPTIGPYQGYGDLACADWPADRVAERGPVTGTGAAPILVVGTTGDPATPYRWSEALADQLESGVLLTYEGEGHTAYGENGCIDDAVNAYLLDGALPAAAARCGA